MKTIGSYEAKTKLPHLLRRVAEGESITITKHGVPIARLVPVEDQVAKARERAIEGLRAFSRTHKLKGLSIRKMIEEGRKH